MKLINPLPKGPRDKYRRSRVKHMLGQIVLHAETAQSAKTAEIRDMALNRILAYIREIHHAGKLNEHKRQHLVRLLQEHSMCATEDIFMDHNKISISAPIDIDVDRLAEHVFW